MGSWAQWTAKTALLAAGFAAAAGGLPACPAWPSPRAAALAPRPARGSASACSSRRPASATTPVPCSAWSAPPARSARRPFPGRPPPAQRARYREHAAGRERQSPASPCGSTAAVLGDSTAGCVSGALAGVTQPRPASGTGSGGTAAGVIQRAVAPVTSVLGVTAPADAALAPLPP